MLKKKIIPVFLASVLVISGTAGFSAGIVSENVYASEEVHTQRLSDFADLLDADQEEELESAFKIRTIPNLLLCPVNGKPIMKLGTMNKVQLKELIEATLFS